MTKDQDPDRAPDDIRYDKEFCEFEAEVLEGLVPKLAASAATVSMVPRGETDVKFAVELGMSIMLDKPILAIVDPTTKVSRRLLRVADKVIYADLETRAGLEKAHREIQTFTENLPE